MNRWKIDFPIKIENTKNGVSARSGGRLRQSPFFRLYWKNRFSFFF